MTTLRDQSLSDNLRNPIKSADSENIAAELLAPKTCKRSYLDYDSMLAPYNPDDLVQKHQDFSIYDDMLKDDAVSACMTLKKEMVLASGFDFISEDESHAEIVEDLKIAFCEDPEWSFDEMLEEVISAYDYGLSITEKVFQKRKDGKLSLRFLKTRHPGPWLLHQDDFGNVVRYEQQGTSNLDVDKRALIHFINRRKFDNPYGTSDLRAAHQAWFTKKHISRWYAVFVEKAGSPIPVGKYDQGKATPEAKNDLYNALKKFQTKSALVIPKEFEIDFLECKTNGEAFRAALEIFNMYIGRALLIPDLMGFAGGETSGGSYTLGKEQIGIFFKHITRRRMILERVINQHLVWPIVLHNFGYVDHYPKFKFRPITEDQTLEYVKLWLEAVKGRVYVPSNAELSHFRSVINFPNQSAEGDGSEDGEEKEDDEEEAEIVPEVKVTETKDGDQVSFAKKLYGTIPGNYEKRVNFSLIESTLDNSLDQFLTITAPVVDDVIDGLLAKVERWHGNPNQIDRVMVAESTQLARMLKKELKAIYAKGEQLAAAELSPKKYAKGPLVDKSFLDVLNGEVDQFAIDWSDKISQRARLTMVESIKDGLSLKQTVDRIKEEIPGLSKTSIERFARTKFTEAMNKGRVNYFEKSGVVAAYQYSAILDDRTTPICAGLHGKIFAAGRQPIPPMHFNCRSMLIPITKYDQWEEDKTVDGIEIDAFIEELKGQGFPKQ